MNILGAAALCMEMGLNFNDVARAISSFSNVRRRFDVIGRVGGIEVVEDYAHHPTELAAVIGAVAEYRQKGRIIAVFQPHRHSRTHDLTDEFARCFYGADMLILTGVYSADEQFSGGRGVVDIAKGIDKKRFDLVDIVAKDNVPDYVSKIAHSDDIVLILGAGDIQDVSGPLVKKLRMLKEKK